MKVKRLLLGESESIVMTGMPAASAASMASRISSGSAADTRMPAGGICPCTAARNASLSPRRGPQALGGLLPVRNLRIGSHQKIFLGCLMPSAAAGAQQRHRHRCRGYRRFADDVHTFTPLGLLSEYTSAAGPRAMVEASGASGVSGEGRWRTPPLALSARPASAWNANCPLPDRSEEHTSELQSLRH